LFSYPGVSLWCNFYSTSNNAGRYYVGEHFYFASTNTAAGIEISAYTRNL